MANPSPNDSSTRGDRTILRREMLEVVRWLRADLFTEEKADEPGHRAFRNPVGYRVVVKPRDDLTGVSGWIEAPDGSALVVTSRVDVQTLNEYLP